MSKFVVGWGSDNPDVATWETEFTDRIDARVFLRDTLRWASDDIPHVATGDQMLAAAAELDEWRGDNNTRWERRFGENFYYIHRVG